jgi:F0F1-type ATP synthase assembly protein I
MPDEPRPKGDPNDDEIDAELAEFEAELLKAADGIPKTAIDSDDVSEEKAPPLPSDDEIEARLSKVIKDAEDFLGPVRHDPIGLMEEEEEKHSPFGNFDPEFDEKLDGFSKKVDKIKASREEVERDKARKQKSEQDSSRGLGVGLTIAYTIIGLPLLGAGIGWLVDGRTGGTTWVGIGTVIGAVLGVAAAISIMNRENK